MYCALKDDTHARYLVQLTNCDAKYLQIDHCDDDIRHISKHSLKKYIKEKVMNNALQNLVKENRTKEKQKKLHSEITFRYAICRLDCFKWGDL